MESVAHMCYKHSQNNMKNYSPREINLAVKNDQILNYRLSQSKQNNFHKWKLSGLTRLTEIWQLYSF